MIDHDRALKLAAAAIDFGLSPSDEAVLSEHLADCAPCRTTATALRADAAAMRALPGEDAPDRLRERVLAAVSATAQPRSDTAPSPRGALVRFPRRYQHRAYLAAAAAVVLAVVGGTLWWRSTPTDDRVAIVDPSRPPSSGSPEASGGPGGSPGPTNGLVTAYAPVATLEPEKSSGGAVDIDTSFKLAGIGGASAAELAERLSVRPAIAFTTAVEPDGRVRITPVEPLVEGMTYRFTLAASDGAIEDSWAFQARQALRVVSTVPGESETEVRLDTGIEVTFDQDGVLDGPDHMRIEPKVEGRFEQRGRVLAFVPERLQPATVYTVTVTRGVRVEGTGDTLERDVRFRFETAASGPSTSTPSFFEFSSDLFESATADRPVIGLWWFGEPSDDGETKPPPATIPLRVYRFPDRPAAIAALGTLRELPHWSLWNSDDRLPTDGLQRVLTLDARLQNANGTLWTALPDPLRAGWYLVEHPAERGQAQAIVQVTDVSAYFATSGTKTVVWANDLATGAPVIGAEVAVEGTLLGRTDRDGLLLADTPAALRPDVDQSCETECVPIVTVTSGGRSTFVPASGVRDPDGKDVGSYGESSDAHYWRVFDTDRLLYRQTDTINAWGLIRDRATGAVPRRVTLRLALQEDQSAVPVTLTEVAPNAAGTFTSSLPLKDVPYGSYRLDLVAGGAVVSSREILIDRILKPAYRIDVTTGRRVYLVGDRIRVDVKAAFIDGTPVPNVPVRLQGEVEATATTGALGTAVVRTTAVWPEETRDGPRYGNIEAHPARAEEGEIAGDTRDFLVFPSSWIITGDARLDGTTVRIDGTLNRLDRERVERELAAGAYTWDIDYRGAPVARRAVHATVVEMIPIKTRIGTSYDFIEKRAVPVYDYDFRERTVRSIRLTTDPLGRFSGSLRVPDRTHEYTISFATTDPDGLRSTATAYASATFSTDPSLQDVELRRTDGADATLYTVGQAIDLSMFESGRPASVARDRHLFVAAQNGIRDAVVRPASRFRSRFPSWGPPNVIYDAVRFTGSGYVMAGSYNAAFRADDRRMRVDLTTDQDSYAPGGQVHLSVRTRDAAGKPLPATVVVRAVDEKLFLIGGAAGDDPLSELYQQLDSGLVADYATHAGPQQLFEGGDTGGGGDDGGANVDVALFQEVRTGADGRGTVAFTLPSAVTSWHVNASALGDGLTAGSASILVPATLPFFVDTSLAPEYLTADRPSIQVRAFGTSLSAGEPVRFEVTSDSLEVHETGLRGVAFEAVIVPLPALSAGIHTITITAQTGSGASLQRHTLRRSVSVVPSRLTRTRSSYQIPTGPTRIDGGDAITELVVSDAGAGRQTSLLVDLAGIDSDRLERALAAAVADWVLASRSGGEPGHAAQAFVASTYQREGGGIALVPHGASDLTASALAALVAPDKFSGAPLRAYFHGVLDDVAETRERRNLALAGLAGTGAPVLAEIRSSLAVPDLTVREQTMLGIAAARLGDRGSARTVAAGLAGRYGESIGDTARLRIGDDTTAVSEATASMAMLLAASGDPVAARYWTYVEQNPSPTVPFELHGAGYARWMLDSAPSAMARFAYDVDGIRSVVTLEPGESTWLRLTKRQLATLSIEPIEGSIGVTAAWQEPVSVDDIKADPDVTIERRVRPATIRQGDFVIVDLVVRFGGRAPAGCHLVVEHVPSGLVPVGRLQGWVDPEVEDLPLADFAYPDSQVAQTVTFCAESAGGVGTARLRYVARVITTGAYVWEPAVVASRTDPARGAVVSATTVRIR